MPSRTTSSTGRTRRALAGLALASAAVGTLTACGASVSVVTEPAAFDRPLWIPPLAESRTTDDGTRVFSLTAQEGTSQFLTGRSTRTWGFNGGLLGPTLRAERGERVAVEFRNELPDATTVHWHGMHLPAAMDGGPHQMVGPGDSWRPEWTVDQSAATLWYHPHPHGSTEEHVYRGLAGMFIVDDPAAAAGLPSVYGVDDVPVIVQDKDLDDEGRLVLDDDGNELGTLGSTVLVNGTPGPYLHVTTELVRLRLLNGSTARTYDFGFDDDRQFSLVGSDGGLLPTPHETGRVRLSPGERAEIVVHMRPGTTAMLHSFPPDLGSVPAAFAFGGNDSFDVLELRAAERLSPSLPLPGTLSDEERLDPSDAAVTRSFELAGRTINGARMEMDRIDEVAELGDTEIWEVRSIDRLPHNFHVHDVQFEVLTIDGAPPPPELAGRKDTVYLEPGREYRLIMRFEDYADPRTPYMYHCHLLLHEDEGLMGQFVVVESGSDPSGTDQLPGGHPPGHEHP
jgi:FtsP/CotA-like multicopper oxidase with cupredoxin domain